MNPSTMKTLLICIDDVQDEAIRQKYHDSVNNYNNTVMQHNTVGNDPCLDSGFDLYAPYTIIPQTDDVSQLTLNHDVQARVIDGSGISFPYYLYPRSSLSKTNFRLANSVGIIDSGYRGSLIAKLDIHNIHEQSGSIIGGGQRYVQICSNDLIPFFCVRIVSREELGSSLRGSGGFGSTGQ